MERSEQKSGDLSVSETLGQKRDYDAPSLHRFGTVEQLTRGKGGPGADGSAKKSS